MRFGILLLLSCSALLFGELPPSAYEALQANAPESLNIQVLQVRLEPSQDTGRTKVTVLALVDKVTRSSALKPNDVITIIYSVTTRASTGSAPGEVPILNEGEQCVAYLAQINNSQNFQPAAGTMSFRNF